MAKNIFIHIGAHKTGSSALQVFLSRNRESLKERGIFYPLSPTEEMAQRGFTTSGNGVQLAQYLIDEDKFQDDWKQYLDTARTHDGDILYSSELFFEKPFARLQKLSEASGNIKVIIYLRPQAEFIRSAYGEALKRQGFTESIEVYYPDMSAALHYDRKLDQLESWFGKDNLIVRPYARDAFKNGSLIADFLAQLDVEMSDAFQQSEAVVNSTLSASEAAMFLSLNRQGLDTRTLARLAESVEMPPNAEKIGLPARLARRIRKAYSLGNARIEKKYFDGQAWLSATPKPQKFDIGPVDALIAWMGSLAEQNARLERELSHQAERIRKLEA